MLKISKNIVFILLLQVCIAGSLFAQGREYEGPEDGAGDPAAERIGYMEGNAIRLQFRNTTELSDWGSGTDPYASKWPNDFRGSKMNDGIGLLIGARVFLERNPGGTDSVVVDDSIRIYNMGLAGQLDTLYFLQTSYREEQDEDPTGQVEWNLYPPRGYMNYEIPDVPPAVSNRPASWPTDGWPSRGFEKKWPGEWNGRFGRGVIKADMECYFVANDAQDQEYLQDTAAVKYYPRPGIHLGDFDPKVSVQRGRPWGGLGVRVEQRGFQWNNPQSRDAIFWEYTIHNISDYDVTQVAFGYWVDNAIGGGDGNDELAAFDTKLDLAYSWDVNGIGDYGLKVGTMGFAYLESPANAVDFIDNDEDGIIDERRDNKVLPGEAKIGPTEGYANLSNFLEFYNLEEEDLVAHFAADEDQDWNDGEDVNGNGVYDGDENPGDDVGLDGVGPGDLNYTGPDADGTECNHIPDLLEGYGSEPDFGLTDISESDMLGLTSFRLFPIPVHEDPYKWWFRNDESMWELVGQDSLLPYIEDVSNLAEVFATGVFPLFRGNAERISMSQLHSWDDGRNIKATDPITNPPLTLFRLKDIVQIIYERDYRFAQPPLMPTLTATPGDGYVLLTWDNLSETKTRESLLANENDFEGYKLYKATDRSFTDAKTVTDAIGNATDSKKALFQCDIIDGRKGFAEYGLVGGMAFYLGNDSGIQHSYRDDAVENGRTYYYALVAYDYGMEDIGVSPSENNIIVEVDEAEQVVFTSRNVAIVTPHPRAAGYKLSPEYTVDMGDAMGSGSIMPELVTKAGLRPDNKYKVAFDVEIVDDIRNYEKWGVHYVNDGIKIFDATDGLNLVYSETPENPGAMLVDSTSSLDYWFINPGGVATDIFDGIRLNVNMPLIEAQYDYINSGWVQGTSPMRVTTTEEETKYFPWDFEIHFTDTTSYTSDFDIGRSWRIYNEDDERVTDNLLSRIDFPFFVANVSNLDSLTGKPEIYELVVEDLNQNGSYEIMEDRIFVGPLTERGRWAGTAFILDFANAETEYDLPGPGDYYKITFNRPFWTTDTLTFSVRVNEEVETKNMKDLLDKVKVVPNPYIATNALEPSLANPDFNQRRRIMFTHVPSQCTIKIFSVSGVYIDEIIVENDKDDGIAYWDLLTKEGLELAAGMYIYHLKAEATGDEIMGKFAVIK